MIRILVGDALTRLRELPNESVHCCVTSPPYWGLRDYGTGTWIGGDPECNHVQGRPGWERMDGTIDERHKRNRDGIAAVTRKVCRCGAEREDQQLGLEPTIQEFISSMVEVFSEVRRVLRKDGSLWMNMGDCYVTTPPGNRNGTSDVDGAYARRQARQSGPDVKAIFTASKGTDWPVKSLVAQSWRLALAMQDDGWLLRQSIIWHKPAPMPESCRDRFTRAHEYIFHLTRTGKYYWDFDAAQEPAADGTVRNRRTIWTVPAEPCGEAHYVTYPTKLVEPCIACSCPPDGVVLDPFGGSGTTGIVADRQGKHSILIELNPANVEIMQRRIRKAWTKDSATTWTMGCSRR